MTFFQRGAFFAYLFGFSFLALAHSETVPPASEPAPEASAAPTLFIQEYRVFGSKHLTQQEIGEAVYPWLGPGRTADDVEQARAALEKAYQEKGLQTVAVQVPEQSGRGGIIALQVIESPVGRLRIKGARFFSPDQIRAGVPSLAEGTVPNFNQVSAEIVALNQNADRSVTPVLRPGVVPGTVDVELTVKDTLPLHGSLELNNRYSANTTPLRLNGGINYNNLWQLGHSIGFSFQIAPERISDALIYSAYYIARAPQIPWLGFMVQGTRQNSNVSTLGGGASAGNGEILGARFLVSLPSGEGFFQSVSVGMDYKHFEQDLTIGDQLTGSPITYYPFSILYNAAWVGKGYSTELTGGTTFSFRGLGSETEEFDNRRYNSDGGFFYFRGSLNHTRDLPLGFQLFGEVQGQATANALVDSEQFSGGGLDTVRGYLESEVLGDNAVVGSIELRSPSINNWAGINEWRVYGFTDAAVLTLNDPLPGQDSQFNLASIGVGSRLRLFKRLNGSLDAGVPLISQTYSTAGDILLTFRLWGDF